MAVAEEDNYINQNEYANPGAPPFDVWVYGVWPMDPSESLELPPDGFEWHEDPDEAKGEAFSYYEPPNDMDVVYNTYAGTDIVAQIVVEDEVITLGELQTISYSMHRENVPVRILGHVNPISFVRGPRTIAGSLIFTVFNFYAFYRLASLRNAIQHDGIYSVADMIPPFDVVLTFSNESGALSKMRLLGVQMIDEGGTMSIDDLVTEQTYQFMARGIQPMTSYQIYTDREIDQIHGPTYSSRYAL